MEFEQLFHLEFFNSKLFDGRPAREFGEEIFLTNPWEEGVDNLEKNDLSKKQI